MSIESADRLRTGAAWVVAGRLVGIGATLASNVLLARLLGPAEFGIFLLISTAISCGAILAMAGLNEAGLRFMAASLAHARPDGARAYLRQMVRWVSLATLVAAAIVCVGIIAFEFSIDRFDDHWLLIGLTAVGLATLAWQTIAAETLRGWHDLKAASLFSGGQGGGPLANLIFLGALAISIFYWGHITSVAALALLVLSMMLTLPIALVCVLRTTGFRRAFAATGTPAENDSRRLSDHERRELLGVAANLLMIQLLAFASQQFDVWIGGALLSSADLGLYGVAKRSMLLAAMPVQMAMLTVVSSIPHLYALGRKGDLERLLRRSAALAAVPSLAALALLVVFPGPLLKLVFGQSYAAAAPALWVMAAGHLTLVLCGNPIHLMAMTGFHKTALAVNCLATCLLVIVGPLATAQFGFLGLAAASSASLALQNGLLWILARRQVGVWTHVGLGLVPEPTEKATSAAAAITMNEG